MTGRVDELGVGVSRRQVSVLIENGAPARPAPPATLAIPDLEDAEGSRTDFAASRRIDRDRRRVYRRAVRRYKRQPSAPRQWLYMPRAVVKTRADELSFVAHAAVWK